MTFCKTVNWLDKYDSTHQAAMLYVVSDHGESLGENGIYLHGMPYKIAPKAQNTSHRCFGQVNSGIQAKASNTELTHDAITPTLLKLFDVRG